MSTIINDDVYGVCVTQKDNSSKKRDYTATPTRIEALAKYGNTSDAIRGLLKEGMTRSKIADMMNIRYQHVRNVELQIIKKK